VLIYLVIRIVWTFQHHELFSVGLYILQNIMSRHSISGNNTEQVLQLQITDLQDNFVITGTNVGVGPGTFPVLTTGTNNTAFGSGAGGALYGITTGSGNVMVGASAGYTCSTGSNNTFDMEVLKQLLHAGIGELTAVVALEYLGGMLLEEQPKYL